MVEPHAAAEADDPHRGRQRLKRGARGPELKLRDGQCVGGRCLPATACSTCVIASCSAPVAACAADMGCKAWFDCHAACNDDACRSCRTLASMVSTASTRLGDPMAGTSFTVACPAGHQLTGFEGLSSGANGFERIRGTCVEARLVAGAMPTVPLTGASSTTMDSGRMGFGGSFPFGIGCPAGQAVAGVQVASTGAFSGLQLQCAPVVVSGAASFTIARGAINEVSGIGTDPFSGPPTFGARSDCPVGTAFASGFAGTLVDPGFGATSHRSIGLLCNSLAVTP